MPATRRHQQPSIGPQVWHSLGSAPNAGLLESGSLHGYIDRHSRHSMMRLLSFICLLLTVNASAQAQIGSDNHLVTVTVSPISILQVTGAGVAFNIGDANAVVGQDQMEMTNATTQLLWGTNASAQKITVATTLGAPLFVLKLVAAGPTVGTAGTEVVLSTVPADLVLGIGRSSGSATLRYTAVVLASQGVGTDSHTITFTLLAQ